MLQKKGTCFWMSWHMCRRSRTICLLLAFVTVFFHLLLTLVSVSIHHLPCDAPLPPRTHVLRDLAHANTSMGTRGNSEPPADSQTDTSNKDGTKHPNGNAFPGKLYVKGSKSIQPMQLRAGHNGNESEETDLLKLKALFDHPLYNVPRPAVPEDDWLLKVKPKVKRSERTSQMWESDTLEESGDVQWNRSSDSHPPWLRFHLGISRWELYPHHDPNMELLIQQLAAHQIVSAVQKSGGTQLKLVMSFPNYGQALFKPKKQERDEETNYNLYYFSDFERHNAEIAAFHLDRILGYRRIPPVVGRLVDVVKEIKDVTTDRKLAKTFFNSPVGNVCFYGQCSYYCSTEHAICGQPRDLEAPLAVMLPDLSMATRRTWRSPWRRSYSRSKLAKWETDPDYCASVKKTAPYDKGTRLVDFMDMVILDFLMSNMDRHHYETFEKFGNGTFLLHLDNGRAFGRHSKDEPSILAPLEQCCRIRRSTWLRLQLLSLPQYHISDVMRASLSQDLLHKVAPLLSEPHLAALSRRLKIVLETVVRCQERQEKDGGGEDVIYDDLDNLKQSTEQ
ncbi:extracellular serine/threonine protein kinase FAM20C-like [Nematolebias whitei]|uniref:extracellular serine/threonine protein kinase FAM20C-like n=1 Tax=Nematolebias whitei TaxID=451745 RepID=UPI00189A57BD|nr:extracellular serine/threonine protein kinase FAM20C-like [Nematolebias whitei]